MEGVYKITVEHTLEYKNVNASELLLYLYNHHKIYPDIPIDMLNQHMVAYTKLKTYQLNSKVVEKCLEQLKLVLNPKELNPEKDKDSLKKPVKEIKAGNKKEKAKKIKSDRCICRGWGNGWGERCVRPHKNGLYCNFHNKQLEERGGIGCGIWGSERPTVWVFGSASNKDKKCGWKNTFEEEQNLI